MLVNNSKEKKILLIEPPFYRLYNNNYSLERCPLSLGYLAGSVIQNTDWNVRIYNADFRPESEEIKFNYLAGDGFDNYINSLSDLSGEVWKEVKVIIGEYNPVVIGISAKSQNFASALNVAKIVKQVNKDIPVVIGGPHPTMVGEELIKFPELDIIVLGEGETTLIELLKAIDNGNNLNEISGIIFREGEQIYKTKRRELINNLDELIYPPEILPDVLIDYDKYSHKSLKFIFATRGCPYNCFFCGSRKIWGRNVRFRSVENVVNEIKLLQSRGLQFIHFDDDTFGVSGKYIETLCSELKLQCPGIKWSCELHVNLVEDDVIAMMKDAGCYSIQVGIESGNNDILRKVRKGFTIEKAFAACEIIRNYSMELSAFFIIGFPFDTEETINDTISAMKRIAADQLVFSIFTPYPGTEAFDYCKSKGTVNDNFNPAIYNHQSLENNFCENITHAKFRQLAKRTAQMVDRKNWLYRMRRIFSCHTIYRLREIGFVNSVKKGIRVFQNK